ncbi:ABC transporter ATP-binding protein [Motilibacter aurantiacus]|uniref:ABC transporter ATP-binding protein n=1 Tax=Motilibacter aurantiacus TaxID=2714955 RepID=UPI0014083FC1|nr:ABC transporter ATP-binding protein [Motilibacter aurantiacus]NHC45128.1 ABC transporter ATP-binding protein [Motilibacter aurantiacus]
MTAAIEIRGLSKVYRLNHELAARSGPGTMAESLLRLARRPVDVLRGDRVEHEQFWALREVDLDVQPGEVVGIIGRNGSGKSTMLKILSRIVEPTAGRAVLRGNVASLLEVGTGFHPELTGRENIFFNGAILGMSQREVRAKFDAIVDFAEVEQFLDTPVKFYSSGMYVRLAFGVAAHLEPDILIVDEVLAVGDAQFQKKSLGRMSQAAREGRTVVFVSHSMATVRSLCDRGVLLHRGRVRFDGPVDDAVMEYASLNAEMSSELPMADRPRPDDLSLDARFVGVDLVSGSAQSVDSGKPMRVRFEVRADRDFDRPVVLHFAVFDLSQMVLRFHSEFREEGFLLRRGVNEIECEVEPTALTEGDYKIDCSILYPGKESRHIDVVESALFFTVSDIGRGPLHLSQREAVYFTDSTWSSPGKVAL